MRFILEFFIVIQLKSLIIVGFLSKEVHLIFFLFFLAVGLVFLVSGAELLVRAAHFLAKRFHVSPFLIGIVLLGMGTSAPEWAVSALSSIEGLSSLAVGNVFGSNVFNALLVLGRMLFKPLSLVTVEETKKDIFFLAGFSIFLIPINWDAFFSRWEAGLLLLLFIMYMLFIFWDFQKKKNVFVQKNTSSEESNNSTVSFFRSKVFFWKASVLLTGFVLLIGGSYLTVCGAEGLARETGMSERLIGILIVSVGTGLPELFASAVALIKGYKDMAFGNIIGSNIFNTFAILGTAGLIQPVSMDSKMLKMDLPVLLITHCVLLLIIFSVKRSWLKKALPWVFVTGYITYVTALILWK